MAGNIYFLTSINGIKLVSVVFPTSICKQQPNELAAGRKLTLSPEDKGEDDSKTKINTFSG